MGLERFQSVEPPWLHLLTADLSTFRPASEETIAALAPTSRGQILKGAFLMLHGLKMTTVDELFDEFGAALQVPYYFAENWPALDECLTDLDWLPGNSYFLLINDAPGVLSEEPEEFPTLIKLLSRAGEEWARPAVTGEASARPAVPFHVVFQCSEDEVDGMRKRLETAGAAFDEISVQDLADG
jgi:hypothetical protein